MRAINLRDHEVRALLAGATQLRRPVKPTPLHPRHADVHACNWMQGPWKRSISGEYVEPFEWAFGSKGVGEHDPHNFYVEHRVKPTYGMPGDALWCREAWSTPPGHYELMTPREMPADTPIRYVCDGVVRGVSERFVDGRGCIAFGRRRPPQHLPRWASRLSLRITDVRVQRLSEVTEKDALAMGYRVLDAEHDVYAKDAFYMNEDRFPMQAWADDIWTWVLTVEVIRG